MQGAYFGEIAILKNCKRTASVKSKNFTTLTALGCKPFKELLARYPNIIFEMNEYIVKSYNDNWKKFKLR